jgi:S-(hydroxymethyl)glutathione dehydrogenase/alcohol dehydrogenase
VLEELNQPLVVEEIELLPLGPREVIVRVEATAVCITDVLSAQGHVAAQPPALLGHAGAGVVEEVGASVTAVEPGDRVVITGTPECGVCYWCVRDQPAECAEMLGGIFPTRHIAARANGDLVAADGGIGTWAERTKLRDIGVVRVDADLPMEHLCLLGCGVTAGLGAVFNVGEVEPGSSVAVVGCGHLGLWMIQAATIAGATQIIAVESRAERRELAGKLGATDLVDPAAGDSIEQVRALTGGRGVDFGFEAAGPPEAMQEAFQMTRPSGTFVPAGWTNLAATVTLSAVDFAIGGRKIHSCQYGGAHIRRDIPRFAQMLEAGLVDAKPIVSRTYPLDEVNEAMRAAEERAVLTGVITPQATAASASRTAAAP